jgi:hypothetical protein
MASLGRLARLLRFTDIAMTMNNHEFLKNMIRPG